jgi:hypothetical protein
MQYTMTEKILARVAGVANVLAGDEILARPDFVIAYDFPGYTDVFFREAKEDFGVVKVPSPERFVLFIDHMVPATAPKEEELHKMTRAWGKEQGVPVHEREGIGHQVSAELGYATPGAFAVHFDGHVSQLGAFGTLALGARKGVLESFVSERMAMVVPGTVKIEIIGTVQLGVMVTLPQKTRPFKSRKSGMIFHPMGKETCHEDKQVYRGANRICDQAARAGHPGRRDLPQDGYQRCDVLQVAPEVCRARAFRA